jgi:PAS domain S-box-containing protein
VVADTTTRTRADAIFRTLLEAAPDAIVVVTNDGMITFVNAQTESMFGYPTGELPGQPVEILIPNRFRDAHPGHRQRFSKEDSIRPMGAGLALYGLRKDGTEFPVEISLSPLATDDGPFVLTAIRDISARKEMEAQIETTRMQMASSARLSALGVMAGGIAHEINNPLGIIHAYASNLLEMARSNNVCIPDMEKASARIVDTAERIGNIVKSLRALSRDGAGDPTHPSQAREMIEQSAELCRERFRMHSIRLVVPEVDPDLKVNCRQVQITQVILNLLQNAFDAVLETSDDRWIALGVQTDHSHLSISVTDSGPGVPPALRHRIMEPFFTTKPFGKGTGLGLSISRSIAEHHGGELKLTERDGHTTFSLILPLSAEDQDHAT